MRRVAVLAAALVTAACGAAGTGGSGETPRRAALAAVQTDAGLSPRVLVPGLGVVEGRDAPALARQLARDEPPVAAAWGDGPFQVVVLAPSSTAAAARLSGQDDLQDVAAVEDDGVVVIDPVGWAQLSPVGRQVTLRHELTHVVSRTATTARTPRWLVEGLADAVGFAGSGLTTAQVAAELTTRVRGGFRPVALPADGAYAPGRADLAATYEEGWLACRLVEARVGVAGLVAVYRETGTRGWAAAVRDVLHTTPAVFTTAWRARVAALA